MSCEPSIIYIQKNAWLNKLTSDLTVYIYFNINSTHLQNQVLNPLIIVDIIQNWPPNTRFYSSYCFESASLQLSFNINKIIYSIISSYFHTFYLVAFQHSPIFLPLQRVYPIFIACLNELT